MHISTANLTVASLAFVNITLLAPPALKILSVAGFIAQSFELTCQSVRLAWPKPKADHSIQTSIQMSGPVLRLVNGRPCSMPTRPLL